MATKHRKEGLISCVNRELKIKTTMRYHHTLIQFSSVQFSSVAQLCLTLRDPWITARQASLSITNSRSLLKLMSIESVMPSNHLILCLPLLLLPSIFFSIRDFSNESVLQISFSISLSNEYSGLIGWISLQFKGLSRVFFTHSSKASILWRLAFFIVQLSHPHTTTGTIALRVHLLYCCLLAK